MNLPYTAYAKDVVANSQLLDLEKLLPLSSEIFCTIDLHGTILKIGGATHSLLGFEDHELKGRTWTDYGIEKHTPSTESFFLRVIEYGSQEGFRSQLQCKNGSIKKVSWSALWDDERKIFHVVIKAEGNRQEDWKIDQIKNRIKSSYHLTKTGWWEWDLEINEYYASDEMYRIYGLNRDAYPSLTIEVFDSLVHPDDKEVMQKGMDELSNINDHEFDHRIIKPCGEVGYVMHYVQVMKDNSGRPIKLQGTTKDITEKKIQDLALRDSEKRLQDILESIGDGFFVLDRQWTVTHWNRKAEELLCVKKQVIIGKNLWDIFNDAKDLPSFSYYDRALTENIQVHFEDFYPALEKWFEVSAYPTHEGLSVYFRDITDRKRQEEERIAFTYHVENAKKELENVLECMTDGFYTVDRNWTILYATNKVAAMLSLKKEDYIGSNLWTSFPDAAASKFFTEYHRAFDENKLVSFEEYLPSFNLWFEVNAYPHGEILSVYIKDISERKKQESRLEFIAKASSEVIWEMNIDSETTQINGNKFKQLFGYVVENNQIDRSFWLDKVHPDDRDIISSNKEYALANNFPFYLNEYRFKKTNGSWAYVKDRTYIVKDHLGQPVSMIGAIEDVTNERISAKALMESKLSYEQLFDNAPLPTMISDINSLKYLNVNQSAIAHFGYNKEEFLEMSILDLRPREEHEKVLSCLSRFRQNVELIPEKYIYMKKNGEKILTEVSITRINYQGKNALLATVNDITEKVKLQEQLVKEKINQQKNLSKATIEAQEQERNEIGTELHDNVNQILTSAKLYIDNTKYFPEQASCFIEKGIELIQKSINEIRRLSKALVKPTNAETDFRETVLQLFLEYKELNLFDVDYYFDFEDEDFEGVEITIYRILQEQFNNTVKYANASKVDVGLSCRNGLIELIYHDNGKGFDPSTIIKGLGLNNIKNRADAYNGSVELESSRGNGCKWAIRFPHNTMKPKAGREN